MFRHPLRAGLCSLALALSAATPAVASEPCVTYKKVVCYEERTTYVTRCEPYTEKVVRYDHCGKAYTVTTTKYREVKVPVVAVVPVVKYAKVTH